MRPSLVLACLGIALARLGAEEWTAPEVKLPDPPAHPCVACTAEELARLREAFRGSGPAHDVVAAVVREADKAIAQPLVFPPRGGQHNQWYQCDACQRPLTTVDDTHHLCPGCRKVYTGPPYDDVIFSRVHQANLARMKSAAWAAAITGERKYSAFAAQVLLGYAERYAAYPYHDNASGNGRTKPGGSGGRLFEQTLDEAYHMAMEIAPAYDLVHATLVEEDRKKVREGLILPILENVDKWKARQSNWQTWHNAAMLWGGACLDDAAWAKKAIDQHENGFVFQTHRSITADGVWYENSWGYHFYSLSAMVAIAEGARRLGADLWSNPALRKMCTVPIEYTMADGSLPRFGDDVETSVRGQRPLLEAAYHATKDPRLLLQLPDAPSWESVLLGRATGKADGGRDAAPRLESRAFTGAGHAILRTQGPAGMTAALTFSPFGGGHSHFDKLSFVLFGFARELGVDPGRAKSQAYRLPIHKDWYRGTISHNAVLVDKEPQQAVAGKLLLFAANDRFAAARAECEAAYPGVRQRRLLVMAPEYLLVFDDLVVTDKKERRFDWVYHSRGTTAVCDATKAEGKLDGFRGGEYVQRVETGSSDAAVRVRFEDGAVTTHVVTDAQPKTQVAVGDGPGASVTERVPLMMATRSGTAVRFAVVLEPVQGGASPQVQAVTLGEKDGTITLTVQRSDGADVLTLSPQSGLEVKRGAEVVLQGK